MIGEKKNMNQEAIFAAIKERHSIRAFLNTPVPRETIADILQVAAQAPSGTNCQPWQVYVVMNNKRDELIQKVSIAYDMLLSNKAKHDALYQEPYPYYPEKWISPYIDRRRQNGWELYGLLDIAKGEKEKMHAQHKRNFQFFDAPVGLFFTVNKAMGIGSKMDIAMMMQNVMIAAKGCGLDTCPQAAWNAYQNIILPLLGAEENEELVCGMALGYADTSHIVNTLHPPRESVDDFAQFLD